MPWPMVGFFSRIPTCLSAQEAVSERLRNMGWVVTVGCDSNGLSRPSWDAIRCGPQPPVRSVSVTSFASPVM